MDFAVAHTRALLVYKNHCFRVQSLVEIFFCLFILRVLQILIAKQ